VALWRHGGTGRTPREWKSANAPALRLSWLFACPGSSLVLALRLSWLFACPGSSLALALRSVGHVHASARFALPALCSGAAVPKSAILRPAAAEPGTLDFRGIFEPGYWSR